MNNGRTKLICKKKWKYLNCNSKWIYENAWKSLKHQGKWAFLWMKMGWKKSFMNISCNEKWLVFRIIWWKNHDIHENKNPCPEIDWEEMREHRKFAFKYRGIGIFCLLSFSILFFFTLERRYICLFKRNDWMLLYMVDFGVF